jgi:hypothetical protein
MSSSDANRRIMRSRQTLHRYAAMTRAGQWPTADLALMSQEVSTLKQIAELHPGKAQVLQPLVEGWKAMIGAVRGKLH